MALAVASAERCPSRGVVAVAAVPLELYARRCLRLAGRSRIGARYEDEVRRALSPLRAEGWQLRYTLPWEEPGDIDSVAIARPELGVVIEAKTRRYHAGHLSHVLEQATWLYRRRRRWCHTGVLAMLSLVRARAVAHVDACVVVLSIDRLTRRYETSRSHSFGVHNQSRRLRGWQKSHCLLVG